MAFHLGPLLIISNLCLAGRFNLFTVYTASYCMRALLSLQFLAEDYTLVDVLYYVTRDDLKCLRLRYCFLPLMFGCRDGRKESSV